MGTRASWVPECDKRLKKKTEILLYYYDNSIYAKSALDIKCIGSVPTAETSDSINSYFMTIT